MFFMFETLKELLAEELQLDPNEITMESELTNDLGINSIELADLVMQCEDKFDIEIDDDNIHNFVTIGDVVKYLEAHK
ncbi:MAG: acyl carrier protein [Clostridia bacterium]|nr:acyl carrier protein [Clostridia bacterium]